jgi:hypothetical protein
MPLGKEDMQAEWKNIPAGQGVIFPSRPESKIFHLASMQFMHFGSIENG